MTKIYQQIQEERNRQDAKWGVQNHQPLVWASILGEEVGEVHKAVLEFKFDNQLLTEYRKELIQVAAVAVAAIECLDKNTSLLVSP